MVSYIFFILPPNLGEMIQFDEHIFQMGWNHQLDIDAIWLQFPTLLCLSVKWCWFAKWLKLENYFGIMQQVKVKDTLVMINSGQPNCQHRTAFFFHLYPDQSFSSRWELRMFRCELYGKSSKNARRWWPKTWPLQTPRRHQWCHGLDKQR